MATGLCLGIGNWSKKEALNRFKYPLLELSISCFFYSCACYYMCTELLKGKEDNSVAQSLLWPVTLTGPISIFLGIASPALLASIFLILYIVLYVCSLYSMLDRVLRVISLNDKEVAGKKLFKMLVEDEETEEKAVYYSIESAVQYGLEVCHLNKKVNDAMGSFFLVMFVNLILSLICCLYGAASIFFVKFNEMILFVSLSFILWSLCMGNFIFNVCSVGQAIENARREAKYAIENLRRESKTEIKENTISDINLLIERLGEPGPLSPKYFFAVNHSAFLGISSTIFTYLIVLTQFKISETA